MNQFNRLIKSSNRLSDEKSIELYSTFTIDKNSNELFLVKKLEEFSITNWEEFIFEFYYVIHFIKYLWQEYDFTNEEILQKLKSILTFILEQEKPERYSHILNVIFFINKTEKFFYIEQYKKLLEENKLFHDINSVFQSIFIELKNNDYFLKTFQETIINNASEVYFFDVKKGFEYLLTLNKNKFKKYFLKLLEYFNLKENKNKLMYFHEYTSLIRNYDKKHFSIILDKLFKKVDNSNFNNDDLKILKNFLIWDIIFSIEKHERKILKNLFINKLSKYFYEKDNHFLIKILPEIKTKYLLFSIEDYIAEYLHIDDIEEFINLYKWTENWNIIYFVYDILKQSWKNNFIEKFEQSSVWKNIKKYNKQLESNSKEIEKNKQKEIEKERESLLKMINPWKWGYYPKLFQDYTEYIANYEWLESIFNQNEIKAINESIKLQLETYLSTLKISNYNDDKIKKILTFEKKQENSYSHTRNSVYLWWIIEISKNINFDLTKYHKVFVLFYPLLWLEDKINDTLEIIWKNIDSKDINYILRVYTEDLHENAIWLRFYNIDTLHTFYQRFKDIFTSNQKSKLENICLDVINSNEVNNIYYKKNFLQIYSEIWWEGKLLTLWNLWKNKYPNFNYFKDYLDKAEIETKEWESMKFLSFIAKELITRYQNKKIILWTVEQIKKWAVELIDTHEIKYPYRSSSFVWLSEKESELLQYWNDKNNFSYIFEEIPNIDIINEITDLLDYSFEIQKKLISWELKWDYELYCFYIRKIFYKYILNLDDSLIKKAYYYKLKEVLNKYDYKITYNFNLSDIKSKFWIDNIEEEAKDIIEKEWMDGVIKLLKENDALSIKTWWLELDKKNLENELRLRPEKDKDFILFVEWITDKIILENAWEKLKWNEEMFFRIENWFDCHHIWRWFKEENHWFLESDNKTFIWMLDFDSAYKQIDLLLDSNDSKNWKMIQDKKTLWITLKHSKKKWYVFLLPVPFFRKDYVWKSYSDKSMLSIELLFDDNLLEWYVDKIDLPWWVKLFKMKTKNWKKINFARSTNKFKKEDFKNFEPIFNVLENIRDWKM